MQLLGYSISICPFNYPPKSQFSPFVLLGVFVLRNFAKVFINLFFIFLSFFLSFFFGVGPMKHTPFFHNTPFQFWWPLARKLHCFCLYWIWTQTFCIYIKKTHTRRVTIVFWVIVWCIPLPLQVCVVRGRSLFRDIWCNFFYFCV